MPGKDWRFTDLGTISHVEMGQSPASQFVSESPVGGVPFLQGNAEFTAVSPIPRLWCRKPAKMCQSGDSLISVRAPVGALNRADRDYCIGRGLAAIRFTGADPDFGYHVLSFFSNELRRVAQGTTFEAVGRAELRGLLFPLCPPEEQRRIAAILDALDAAIRRTEQVIAKLQQMKQGLIADLLMKGVDEQGALRPSHCEAPHLYKESPLGRIPKGWNVGTVLDVAPPDRQCILTGPFGVQLGSKDFVSTGVPVLRIGNVQWGSLDLNDLQFITSTKALALNRYRVRTGDLLFARQGATTGRNALADERVNGAIINYHIIRVSIDETRCHPTYLYACFNSSIVQHQVDREKGRGTREGVNTATIAAIEFCIPPIEEQRHVSLVLNSADRSIEGELAALAKLRIVKLGLIHDLMMGRFRVPRSKEAAV